MFGRFTSLLTSLQIRKKYGIEASYNFEQRYNVAPNQMAHIVKNSFEGRQMALARWDILPFIEMGSLCCDHQIDGQSNIPAKQQKLHQAFSHQRCIIPVSGFYVWDQTGSINRPYYITMADKTLISLAGVWQSLETGQGQLENNFSILTTKSNSLIAKIYHRMPLLLADSEIDAWLDAKTDSPEQLKRLLEADYHYPIEAYEVPTLINNTRFDAETCIIRI